MLRKILKISPGACLKDLFKSPKQPKVVQHGVVPEKSFKEILEEEMEKALGKDSHD